MYYYSVELFKSFLSWFVTLKSNQTPSWGPTALHIQYAPLFLPNSDKSPLQQNVKIRDKICRAVGAVKSLFWINTFSAHDFQGQNGVHYTFSSKICQETHHISLQQQATARVRSKLNVCDIKLEICSLVSRTGLFTKQWHLLCG